MFLYTFGLIIDRFYDYIHEDSATDYKSVALSAFMVTYRSLIPGPIPMNPSRITMAMIAQMIIAIVLMGSGRRGNT